MKTPASERLDRLETYCREHACEKGRSKPLCECYLIDPDLQPGELCLVSLAMNALRAGADQ